PLRIQLQEPQGLDRGHPGHLPRPLRFWSP
ncbi:hypothetical protein BN1708_018649, partial [Verticillium longisporum]